LVSSGFVNFLSDSPTTNILDPEPTPIPEETLTTDPNPLPTEGDLPSTIDLNSSGSEIQVLTGDPQFFEDLVEPSQPAIEETTQVTYSENNIAIGGQTVEEGSLESTSSSFIVKLSNGTSINAYTQILLDAGILITGVLQELNAVVASGNYENLEEFSGVLPEGYSYFEENLISLSILDAPNDPYYSLQYGLELINAPKGWKYQKGSSKITIAVLDTGVDLTHPDLAGKLVAGYNFIANNDTPQDDNGHGTGVAGICAAMTDNGTGIAGVSWGASIMPVKVLDASGNGSFTNAAQGIIWAADHGAQVINLSLGGYTSSSLLEDAINYALQKGVVVVAASGNGGIDMITYPARYEGVIAVGSVDQNSQRSAFSNYGPELDVVAPGSAIFSLTKLGSYGYLSGTSAAAPFTSGLAALMMSANSNSYKKVGSQICKSSLDLGAKGFDEYYGCGLIQVDQSLKLALGIGEPKKAVHGLQIYPRDNATQPTNISISNADLESDLWTNEKESFISVWHKELAALISGEFYRGKGLVLSDQTYEPVNVETKVSFNPILAMVFAAVVGLGFYIQNKNRSGKNE
jgi:subtilisin family serine protease